MRARLAWVLFGLGSLLLACGLVAGVVNHEVMDGQRFAAHVDNIRKDPAVAEQLGLRLSERVIEADPDLVAVKPLVEGASISLVSSSAFDPVVQRAADELHSVFTETEPPILRLADVGAVLSAASPTARSRGRHAPAAGPGRHVVEHRVAELRGATPCTSRTSSTCSPGCSR